MSDGNLQEPVAGFIFDMDETLVATSGLWHRAASDFLKARGYVWSPSLAAHYAGMSALDVAATLVRILGIQAPLEECQSQMRGLLIALFQQEDIAPMPGAEACLRLALQHGPLALASGSPPEAIDLVLDRWGWRGLFSVVISSESVPRGKPAPDVFLAAARALDVPASQCLVFEDSLVGVQAAQAAGMRSFAVPSSHPEEIARIASRVFPSLAAITAADWRKEEGGRMK